MTNERRNSDSDDAVWPDAVKMHLGFGNEHVSDVLWRCDALRAGKLYSRSLFATKLEADEFAARLREAEPDQIFQVERIKASSVWN